jgi:hypothetical protein
MAAEIEHQEAIDRIVYGASHLTAPEVEQRARVAVNREAAHILRGALGGGYDAWVTQTVLDRLAQVR